MVSVVRFSLLAFVFALAASPAAMADTWAGAGPSGGVVSIAPDASSPHVAYAATPGGVWRTADGTSWTRVLAVPARDVAVDATRLVAATAEGVWRSTDDGANWFLSTEGFRTTADRDVLSVALGPGVIYAGTQRSVLESTDGGVTWAPAGEGDLPNPAQVADLVANGGPTGTWVYAATATGVFLSQDAGATWSEPAPGTTLDGPVTALAVDTSPGGGTPDRVWAVEDGEVHRTPGILATGWTATGVTGAHDVAVAGADPDVQVHAATDAGVRRSDENGTTWTTPATLAGVPLAAVGATAAEAWAAGPRDGAFRSVDDGLAWSATGALRGSPVAAVSFAAAGSERTLWAGGAFGVQRSTDGGATWARREGGLPARPVAIDVLADPFAATAAYMALTGGGAWRTTDGGATWTAANAGLPSTDVRVLAADPQVQGRIFAGTAAGVARSANGGGVWTAGSGVPSVPVLALAVDPAGTTLLAGTQGAGLYRSSDGGVTWTATGGAPLAGATVQAVHVGGGVALAASGPALFRSTDAGATWTRVGTGLPAGLAPSGFWQHPAVPSLLVLAAGADGLYRSADAGVTWRREDIGLDAAPRDLAGDARTLVAATAGDGLRVGTLRRDLSLTATALPSPVLAGEIVTLTVGVANAGPSPATGTSVALAVPDGFAVRAATPSQGTCTTAPLACQLGTLPPSSVATVTVVVRSTVAGSIPVTISATAEQADRTPADDTRVFDIASTDDTPPRSLRVKGTTLQRPFQTGTEIQLGWSAVDAGTGVSRYDVRYRRGTSAGRFQPFVIWQNRTARSNALFTGEAGSTYCFSVRAVDAAGNLSRYSTEKCTAIPFDDTSLSRRGAWAREGSRTAYRGATVRSSRRGAALVRANVRAKRISLVATVCRRCGSVDVLLGRRLLKTVSLNGPVTRTRQVLPVLLATGIRAGTLTIRVATQGRIVRIDGLGLSAR